MNNKIEIIPSHQINKEKWDGCVQKNLNGLIYSTSNYLDLVAENWDGLVYNDYTCILPLPWKKKFGIKYCYTPLFIQQLGLIGPEENNWDAILHAIASFVPYGDFHFNFSNTQMQPFAKVQSKTNFIILLSNNYAQIRAGYKKDTLTNIVKSEKSPLNYLTEFNLESVDLFHKMYDRKIKVLSHATQANFTQLCKCLYAKGQCFTRTITNNQDEVLATAVYFKDDKRIYNVMNTTTIKGRKIAANYFLIDQVLQEWAGSDLVFDFEGSALPGVSQFYEKFGAVLQPYFYYHLNKLPPLIRWIKP